MMAVNDKKFKYVITCGDEGIQINEGKRISLLGSGYKLEHFSEIIKALKKVLKTDELRIVSHQDSDWFKKQTSLTSWRKINDIAKQEIQKIAQDNSLLYSGYLTYTDPRTLKHGIKGHMVRPKGVHVASKIDLTVGGGEDVYSLASYQISADWVSQLDEEIVKQVINKQIEFFKQVAKKDLKIKFVKKGILSEEQVEKNIQMLEKVGIIES